MATKLSASANNWLGTGTTNDSIDADAGDDTLDGALGNDTLWGSVGNDLVAGGAGNDVLYGGDGNDVLDGGINNDSLLADAGNDFVYGGTGDDTLYGSTGNDNLSGGNNNDTLYGGVGTDALDGGDGNDTLYDSDSATYGTSNAEHDELIGGTGSDKFYGGYDFMWGNEGNDTFIIKNQATVYGGSSDDTITVSNTNATLASWLDGNSGNDTITAGSGNDTLFSGYGSDRLNGGAGNDNYIITFDEFSTQDITTDSSGTDTAYYIRDFKGDSRDDDFDVTFNPPLELDPLAKDINYAVTLPKDIENAVLDDQIYVNNPDSLTYVIAWLTGNTLNNRLTGSSLYDILDGAAGNDTISAGDGNDIIYVGQGTDSIDGGAGEDMLASTVTFDLKNVTNVEDIDLLNAGSNINAIGNGVDNVLSGSADNNSLIGNAGDDVLNAWPVEFKATVFSGKDTLIGGTGNDNYYIDSANEDVITEMGSTIGGIDTVNFKSFSQVDTYTLAEGVENLNMVDKLTQGVGNNLNNRIIGNAGANTIRGGYGDDYLDGSTAIDTLEGGYGDDTYVVDDTKDTIKENSGQGNDWVQSEKINLNLSAQPNWGDIENARLIKKADINVSGNAVNNSLVGNEGVNKLDGLAGIDTLAGGKGNDTYVIDSLTDTLIEIAPERDSADKIKEGWRDTIQSSISFSIVPTAHFVAALNFENLTLSNTGTGTTATGNLNDNEIKGNDIANTLYGLEANDTLDGAGGLDTLIGGIGDDTYILSNDGDVVKEEGLTAAGEGGNDTVEISYSYDLTNLVNIENLTLGGINDVNGTGNIADNIIKGNAKKNLLNGGAGNDSLTGGEGIDTIAGGTGADTIDLTESTQVTDTVRIAAGDNKANITDADKVIKFKVSTTVTQADLLDLPNTLIAANTGVTIDGIDAGTIKSHQISNGIVKFFSGVPTSVSSSNLSYAIEYLVSNITTNGTTVAFQVGSDMWVFQDGGTNDILVQLVGVGTITALSNSVSGISTIHII